MQWGMRGLLAGIGLITLATMGWSSFGSNVLVAAISSAEGNTLLNIGSGNGHSSALSLSADGRVIAFASTADDLVAQDRNLVSDIFIHTRETGQINRASLTDDGNEANGPSYAPSLSADGRFVAFESDATNLVLGDTNKRRDIFVRDLVSGRTERISVSSSLGQANGDSFAPSISGEGRYVVYESDATNLAPGDANQSRDIFLYDRHTRVTRRISVDSSGGEGNHDSYQPMISADGVWVVFESLASNLVANDANLVTDIFLHNVQSGVTGRISVGHGGEGNGPSTRAAISATGAFVAFRSFASNLIANDLNHTWDLFIYSVNGHTLEQVSVSSNGTAGNPLFANPEVEPVRPAISADGRYVLFQSDANNFVAEDTNGVTDIFLRDRQNRTTSRISVADTGAQGTDPAFVPALSSDGRYAAFLSASALTAVGNSGFASVYFKDRQSPPTPTATVTPTATFTLTPSATPTPTATITPTATADQPQAQMRIMLPLISLDRPLTPPILLAIDNEYANRYTVHWDAPQRGEDVRFVLEESTQVDFSNPSTVYSGSALAWQAEDKGIGQYFYRVKAQDGVAETSWSEVRAATIYPLFVGLALRWQGIAKISSDPGGEVGYTWEESLFAAEGVTVKSNGRQSYSPNPLGWPEDRWISTYEVTTGAFLDSSLPPDTQQRWGHPWILPYALQLNGAGAIVIDGQTFILSGPHVGETGFGLPIHYWRLTNRDRFLLWADGAGTRHYVNPNDVELWYDSGASRLLLRQEIVRRIHHNEVDTGAADRYSLNLVEANAFAP